MPARDDEEAPVVPLHPDRQSDVVPATHDESGERSRLAGARTETAILALGRELHAHAHDPATFLARAATAIEQTLGCAYVALVVREGPSVVVAREPLPIGPDGVPGLGLDEPPTHLLGPEGEATLDPVSLLRVPIELGGVALGELRLHGGGSPLDEGDRQRADWFAAMLAGPMVSARWASHARRLDPTDPLTGLANRRAFTRRLQEEIARSERYGVPLGLLLCRIDDPGPWGPSTDRVAKLVGASIRASIRDVDIAARWSDESFLVLLPHQELDGVAVVGRRIHQRIAALPLAEDRPVTVSVAVASRGEGERALELMERAYRALDRARDAGGDRVELSEPAAG